MEVPYSVLVAEFGSTSPDCPSLEKSQPLLHSAINQTTTSITSVITPSTRMINPQECKTNMVPVTSLAHRYPVGCGHVWNYNCGAPFGEKEARVRALRLRVRTRADNERHDPLGVGRVAQAARVELLYLQMQHERTPVLTRTCDL